MDRRCWSASWRCLCTPGIRKDATLDVDHYGPTAQDFHAAFGLGDDDDTLIGTQDADGVALAAIQGLNTKFEAELKARDVVIDAQAREIADLRRAVEVLLPRRLKARPPPPASAGATTDYVSRST